MFSDSARETCIICSYTQITLLVHEISHIRILIPPGHYPRQSFQLTPNLTNLELEYYDIL